MTEPITYAAAVVSRGATITGVVGEDIVVIPNMHPSYYTQVMDARAAIAEVGGQLAHLAVVCRESRRTMMVLPDACELLTPGMRVTLDPSRCEIRVEPLSTDHA